MARTVDVSSPIVIDNLFAFPMDDGEWQTAGGEVTIRYAGTADWQVQVGNRFAQAETRVGAVREAKAMLGILKPRGRPAGSLNKPKPVAVVEVPATVVVEAPVEAKVAKVELKDAPTQGCLFAE